jgi:hypothetical protein
MDWMWNLFGWTASAAKAETPKEEGQSNALDISSLMTSNSQTGPPSPPMDWLPSESVQYSTAETPRMRVLENRARFPDISQRLLADVSRASLGLVSKLAHAEKPQPVVRVGRPPIIQMRWSLKYSAASGLRIKGINR